MLQKRWNLLKQPDQQQIDDLKRAINAGDVLASLLLQRGISNFDDARLFFNPSANQLHNPFLMKDMEQAVKRITQAMNNDENILIYGDYDVDGTSAVSLTYLFLSQQYDKVSYYIPDRYAEGYGVSFKAIDFASDNDISLIIALDCGVKAIKQITYAAEKGIDFIVCDHHLPGDELPPARAILNPLQNGCEYPYKALCGCGIGFKLIQALAKTLDIGAEEPFKYIDLVAIATAADIVPMVGENRVLTHLGMNQLQRFLRPGLSQLLEGAGLAADGQWNKKTLTVTDLVFKIGPRINAAGRMKHGRLAVELLTAKTQNQAKRLAEEVNLNNAERKDVDQITTAQALEMIEKDAVLSMSKSTVLFASHWHKGVIGIAASRIQESYYRPTIILTESNGKATGSARSVKGFDVHAAIEGCADLLENYGGHPAAAGMTLPLVNVAEFQQRFEKIVAETITADQLFPTIDIDLEVNFTDLNLKMLNQINRMAPFGPGNMRPNFVTHGVKDTGKSKRVGDGTHLKLEVIQGSNSSLKMGGIGFGMGDFAEEIATGRPFSIVYTLEENEYKGQTSLQLMLKDIKFIG